MANIPTLSKADLTELQLLLNPKLVNDNNRREDLISWLSNDLYHYAAIWYPCRFPDVENEFLDIRWLITFESSEDLTIFKLSWAEYMHRI